MHTRPLLAMLAALAAPAWTGVAGETDLDLGPPPGRDAALAGRASVAAAKAGDGAPARGKPGAPPPMRDEPPRTLAAGPRTAPPLRDPQTIARALFHGGDSAVQAGVGGMPPSLPARRFPCANCHGADGLGGVEGTRTVPSIVPLGRPALDARLILLALTQGIGAEGRRLDPLMPRYAIAPPEAEALAAFLADLPAQERQGVAPDRIILRLVPPPPAAPLAEAFAAGFVAEVADRVPWGRRIELVAGEEPAFAALGFAAGEDPDLPLVAPLGPGGQDGPLRALCAGFEAEIEALLGTLPPGTPLHVMGQGPLAERARGLAEAAGHAAAARPDAAVLLLARAEAEAVPPGARVLGIAAQLHAPLPERLARAGHRVTLSDGCAGVPGVEAAPEAGAERAHQLGVAVGEAVWQALVRSGRNLTRTRFLEALGQGQPPLSERGAPPVITDHPSRR